MPNVRQTSAYKSSVDYAPAHHLETTEHTESKHPSANYGKETRESGKQTPQEHFSKAFYDDCADQTVPERWSFYQQPEKRD